MGPNAKRDYVIARMNEMKLFPEHIELAAYRVVPRYLEAQP